ncbi:hypothetical protein ACLOJK_012156 [Asimina triloba]
MGNCVRKTKAYAANLPEMQKTLTTMYFLAPSVDFSLSLSLARSITNRRSLSSCSSASCTSVSTGATLTMSTAKQRTSPQNHPSSSSSSDTSTNSEIPISADCSSSSSSRSRSLRSNLSLQTLPSVVSLQQSSPVDGSSSSPSLSYTCLSSLKARPSHVSSLALAPTSNLLYSTSANEIHVWDLTTFSHSDAFPGSLSGSGSVKCVLFSDGKIFTAHQDSKIRVWRTTHQPERNHLLVASLPKSGDVLRRFLFPKNYVRVRRHKKRLWLQHADAVSSLAARNCLLYSVSWDKSLKVWRESDLRCLESVTAHEDAVNAVAVASDGTVYTGSADSRIRVWAKALGEKKHSLVATLQKHKSAVNALSLSEDGSELYSGACDRSILVWEKEDSAGHMAVTGALRGHTRAILCLTNVGDLLLSGSADQTVRIWRRSESGSRYACLAVIRGHEKPVKALAAAWEEKGAGGVTVCSGSLDGEIKVWRVWDSSIGRSDAASDLVEKKL